MQAKLLRVLQEGEVRAIGSDRQPESRRPHHQRFPDTGASRSSRRRNFGRTFYRLHVYPITVPTLNERSEDIPLLANHFLGTFASQQGKKAETLHPSLVHFMTHRTWPGNVRELEFRLADGDPGGTRDDRVESQPSTGRIPDGISRFPTLQDRSDLKQGPFENACRKWSARFSSKPSWRTVGTNQRLHAALQVSERTIRYKIGQLHLARGEAG